MSSGQPTDEALPASRSIDIARWATIVATCSVMVSPPLANAAMAVMLIGLLASGQAGVRLRQACTQPLGVATLLLIGVIGVAMLWGEAPWRDRWAAFWSWRKLWMIPVALALFGPLYWKRRLALAYVAVCGVAMIALVRAGRGRGSAADDVRTGAYPARCCATTARSRWRSPPLPSSRSGSRPIRTGGARGGCWPPCWPRSSS